MEQVVHIFTFADDAKSSERAVPEIPPMLVDAYGTPVPLVDSGNLLHT
jgi:hypothetical protein